jgi:hypothetical protein
MQRCECEHCKKEEYVNTVKIKVYKYDPRQSAEIRVHKLKKMYKNVSKWTNI